MGRFRELWVVIAFLVISVGAVLALGRDGWDRFGVRACESQECFCERFHEGPIRQPANSASNLGFAAVAVALAWRIGRERHTTPSRRNRLTTTALYPSMYVLLVAYLGTGALFLHATFTPLGGRLDVASMFVYVNFLFLYNVARRARAATFVGAWIALSSATIAINVARPALGIPLFGAIAVCTALLEFVGPWRARDADRRWLAGAAALMALALAVWIPSRQGGPLCAPDSLLQGHAAWHLLCAGATACLWRYFRSEQESP